MENCVVVWAALYRSEELFEMQIDTLEQLRMRKDICI